MGKYTFKNAVFASLLFLAFFVWISAAEAVGKGGQCVYDPATPKSNCDSGLVCMKQSGGYACGETKDENVPCADSFECKSGSCNKKNGSGSKVCLASGSGTQTNNGGAFNYVPLEPIPGFEEASDFPQYVSAIYKFGLWTVSIAALLMLTIGGFMYMTSAGNSSKIDTAKKIIYDSIWGLLVAMFAWLILYVINPDLVSGTLNFRRTNDGTYAGAGAAGVVPSGVARQFSSCKDPDLQRIFKDSANGNVDACLLEATAFRESRCTFNGKKSNDCGMMQIQLSVALANHCPGVSVESDLYIQSKSVACAAKILENAASNSNIRKSPQELFVKDLAAFYRWPVGVTASNDCPGLKKYECTINDGNHSDPTSAYNVRITSQQTLEYYQQCKRGT